MGRREKWSYNEKKFKTYCARAAEVGRAEWRRECATNLAGLRAKPSAAVVEFVRLLDGLEKDRQLLVAEANVDRYFELVSAKQLELLAAVEEKFVRQSHGIPRGINKKLLRSELWERLSGVAGEVVSGDYTTWRHQLPMGRGWKAMTRVDTGGTTRQVEVRTFLHTPNEDLLLATSMLGIMGLGDTTCFDLISRGEELQAVNSLVEEFGCLLGEVLPKLVQVL